MCKHCKGSVLPDCSRDCALLSRAPRLERSLTLHPPTSSNRCGGAEMSQKPGSSFFCQYQITDTHRTNLSSGVSIQMLLRSRPRSRSRGLSPLISPALLGGPLLFLFYFMLFLGLLKHITQQPTLCTEMQGLPH